MKRVLITGANSFVGVNVEKWLLQTPDEFIVETVDTMNEAWKKADFAKYDVVFHVAGIAHVDPKPKICLLYTSGSILSLGLKFFVLQMITIVLFQANSIIIARVVSPEARCV